jgi:hypothetical protein
VSNVDGEDFNLEDLELPDDELLSEESAEVLESMPEAESALVEPVDVEPLEEIDGLPPADIELQEEPEEAVPPAAVSKSDKMALYIELGSAIGVSVLLLAIAVIGLVYISTALFLISVAAVGYAIWRNRETSTIYTILLGCALIAVLTSLYCLWSEIGRYEFDIRARGARQRVGMLQPAEKSCPTVVG